MLMTDLDDALLAQAIALAGQAIGLSDPNPRVGCILVDRDGRILGRGHTQQAGGHHAEVMALRDADSAGRDTRGCTAYVSLEPCAHQGRTPPCANALISAGVQRVVVARIDPFQLVAGQGVAKLRAAGVQVDVASPGTNREAASDLNIGFFSRVIRHRPWVRMKIAMSLDARTALPSGVSQWITGAEARADGHAWRARSGAVLTGIGTVLADDPALNVRLSPTVLQPKRIVLDSKFRTPIQAKLLQSPGEVHIVGAVRQIAAMSKLAATGAQVVLLPNDTGQIDLPLLLTRLADQGVNELHVEAGGCLNGALLNAGLVDELLVYVAPKLLGPGRGIADLPGLTDLEDAERWVYIAADVLGQDLRIRLRRPNNGWMSGKDLNPA
jgi:diaminohydroxyphosphoribosylaminopyrimidine deaminase / 5-amino-6-(5-phosphoribosylamino)uracil reductase